MGVDITKFPRISIIIPTRNRVEDLLDCLKSLKRINYPNYEIIVIDDYSEDNTIFHVQNQYPDVILVINKRNEGAAISRNKGASVASGKYLFFLDSDTEVDRQCLDELILAFIKRPSAGLVAPRIYYFGDRKRIWYSGATISLLTSMAHYKDIGKVDDGTFSDIEVIKNGHAPTAFMIKKEVFDEVNGFDPSFFMGLEEADLARRIEKAGYEIILAPMAKVWHKIPVLEWKYKSKFSEFLFYISFRNATIAYHTSKNRIRYMKRHAGLLNFVIFLAIFLPLSAFVYVLKSVLSKQYMMGIYIIKGSIDGLRVILRSSKKEIY